MWSFVKIKSNKKWIWLAIDVGTNTAMNPRLDTGGWLTLTENHCLFPPDRVFRPARYAELSSAR